jgi:hypothetical protein
LRLSGFEDGPLERSQGKKRRKKDNQAKMSREAVSS